MTTASVSDQEQRELALDPRQSYICEAPAGSGKTELLTQRLLTLLACVGEPEEILAITFTRKAAGEMRHRIISALKKARSTVAEEDDYKLKTLDLARAVIDHDRKKQWNLIESPSRLQIKTFDSLCNSLANTLPMHSSFAAPPQVDENVEELYSLAARQFIASIEQSVPWADSLEKVLVLLDNNTQKIERLFINMLSQREIWLPLIGRGGDQSSIVKELEKNLRDVREESVRKLKRVISPQNQQLLVELAAFAASNLKRGGKSSPIVHCLNINLHRSDLPDADEKGIQQWRGLVSMLLSSNGSWRKAVDARCGFPRGEGGEKLQYQEKKQQCLDIIEVLKTRADLKNQLLDVQYLPTEKYDDDQRALLCALIDILPVLSAYLTVVFQERNSVDYSEVSIRARLALGKLDSPTDLTLALDYKIRHILVDEFQDTSPTQIELLKQLIAGWEVDDGRTLFCVGDAMQSIYGFRGANVGLFLQCIESGLGHIFLKPLKLSTNFRSHEDIVGWVNTVFSDAFPRHNDISVGAVSYSPSVAHIGKGDQGGTALVHGFLDGMKPSDEASSVLSIVKQTQSDDPKASIAILVRNRNHAMHITHALDNAGIKYKAVDLEPLADKIVIQDLMSLTHALLYPADRIAWLSILRAPWCGLTLVDLEAISNVMCTRQRPLHTIFQQIKSIFDIQQSPREEAGALDTEGSQSDFFIAPEAIIDEAPIRSLTKDGRSRLERVLPILEASIAQLQRKSLRQWIEGAWVALGGPSCLRTQRELTNAKLFFSLLESIDELTILKKRDALEKAVGKLFSAPDPQSNGQLQIMTIHKAKGLEFDTVIVPSLHRSQRRPDSELLRWHERLSENRQRQVLMSPITSSGKERDAVYSFLTNQEKHRNENEICRLLYVACTRAKRNLHLLAMVKPDKKDTVKLRPPVRASLLYAIWNSVEARIQTYEKTEQFNAVQEAIEKPKCLYRLTSQWQMSPLQEGRLLSQYVPFFQHEHQNNPAPIFTDPIPRIVGTFVHRILQNVDEDVLVDWKKYGLQDQEKSWSSWLRNFSIPTSDLDAVVKKVSTIMQNILDDHSKHWIFSRRMPVHIREFSITMPANSGFEKLIVDLLVFDGSDTWIIDFKTSQPAHDENLAVFLSKEASAYKKIMFKYKMAVERLGYKNVRLVLYFPVINNWFELDGTG